MNADPDAIPPDLDGHRVTMRVVGPPADAAAAWRFLGDTDWFNRAVGNGAVASMKLSTAGDGLPVLDGALKGPAGLSLPYHEAWMSWERGRYFRQVRQVATPLLRGTDWVGWYEGGRPHIQLSLHGPALAVPVLRAGLGRIRARTEAALGALEKPAEREVPAEVRPLLDRWREDAGPAVDRVREHLRSARPVDIVRMRPFALADLWGEDREQLLDAFLLGVKAGVLELTWNVVCRRCYGNVGGGTSLSDVADHATCPACKLSSATDLAENVEVTFAPHPSVLPRREERFCTLFPASAPEQHGLWTLAPGQELSTELPLTAGEWRLGAAGRGVDRPVRVREDGATQRLEWAADGPDQLLETRAGPVRLQLRNAGDRRQRVYLTRMGGDAPAVMAALLTARPAFRRQFGHEVLGRDVRVSVRAVALLFTDLSGSTAMYEEVGDARAFGVVRDHFDLLRAAIEAERGVVVKTIGDAVMAAFHEPEAGVRAALVMAERFGAWRETLGLSRPLGLKVGVHYGPALAVHTDQAGLDWFGGTVNLAARAQGAASAGEVLLTEAVLGDARVQQVLTAAGRTPVAVEASLKGIGVTRLWRV